jgi:hypothetical protein
MTNQPAKAKQSNEDARRDFLKKIGKGSVTVPAAVLLLAAASKQAKASPCPSGGSGSCVT